MSDNPPPAQNSTPSTRQAGFDRDYTNSVLAGIMHDLRNVLTNIIGSAEVAAMTTTSPEMRERLNNIIHSGERGSAYVKLLYHLMHGDKPAPARIDLQKLLIGVVMQARRQLPPSIRLDLNTTEALPSLFGYGTQIEQMLLQLIDNAAHAIQGDGRIEVCAEKDAKHPLAASGRPAVCLRITDSGAGIAEADLPHVFEPLWSRRKEDGANGLGLTMAQHIVHWHHGEIAIRAAPDGGCEVSIHLPSHTAS